MNETHKKSKTSTNPIDSLANHLGTSVKRLNNEIKKNIGLDISGLEKKLITHADFNDDGDNDIIVVKSGQFFIL